MINALQPTGDQVRAFRDRQTGQPIAMLRDEDYQGAQQHRAAGLAGQLPIECGTGFTF